MNEKTVKILNQRTVSSKTNYHVSVIAPIYNEELYLPKFLNSLLVQTYPVHLMEFVFIDGMSNDQTIEILHRFHEEHPELKISILQNPERFQVFALNQGIRHSTGDVIIRLDVHSAYPDDYIEKCIRTLIETGADNVGGLALTKGYNFFSKVAAKMLSSKFGVGNSGFRTHAHSGYVDTVPFGTYRKELFEKIGLFDERLIRNEDNEFNYRIRKNGGKIYLNSEISFDYYCRDTYQSLLHYAFLNGQWNLITSKLVPRSMGVRHFVPFFFVLFLLLLIPALLLSQYLVFAWLAVFSVYILLDVVHSGSLGKGWREKALLFFLFPSFHVAYGFGSLVGLLRRPFIRHRRDPRRN